MPALDRLFDHPAPDGFTSTALLGQGFQGFDDQFERIVEVRTLVLGSRVSGRGLGGWGFRRNGRRAGGGHAWAGGAARLASPPSVRRKKIITNFVQKGC